MRMRLARRLQGGDVALVASRNAARFLPALEGARGNCLPTLPLETLEAHWEG
jgi:hypothetical protein